MNSIITSTSITKLLGTLVLGFLLLLVPLNNIQFILLGVLPLGIYFFLIRVKALKLSLNYMDLAFIGFLFICFLSCLWAGSAALVWTQAFGWLGLASIIWSFRSMTKFYDLQPYLHKVFVFFFVVIMVHHLSAVQFQVEVLSAQWNVFMAKNSNETACYLLALLPFLLYYKSTNPFISFLKLTAIILILNLLAIVNAKGAYVALMGLLTMYFWIEQKKLPFIACITLVLVAAVLYLYQVFNPGAVSFLPTPLDEPRVTLIGYSIDIFKSNPLLGVGLGNWHTMAYGHDLSAMPSFNNPDLFTRHNSYNLYFQLISELGLVGALFFATFIALFFKGIHTLRNSLTSFEKAAAASFVIYLICSYFFKGVNINDFSFSGTELLAFISLGIITNRFAISKYKLANGLLALLSILVIVWFSYSMYSWHKYQNYKLLKDSDGVEQRIAKLTKVYSPLFKIKNGYNTSLDLELAELYGSNGNNNLAEQYYKTAIEREPFNCHALLSYADYYFSNNTNKALAHDLLKRVEAIQPNSNLLRDLRARFME